MQQQTHDGQDHLAQEKKGEEAHLWSSQKT